MTLCWASEVVIYACIPDEVPEYATMCVTSLAGTALMLVPFWGRVAAAVRKAGWRFVLTMLGVAALSAAYNYHFIAGLEFFGVVVGAAFVVAGSLAQILDFGALRGGRNATGSCRGAPSRARRSPAS